MPDLEIFGYTRDPHPMVQHPDEVTQAQTLRALALAEGRAAHTAPRCQYVLRGRPNRKEPVTTDQVLDWGPFHSFRSPSDTLYLGEELPGTEFSREGELSHYTVWLEYVTHFRPREEAIRVLAYLYQGAEARMARRPVPGHSQLLGIPPIRVKAWEELFHRVLLRTEDLTPIETWLQNANGLEGLEPFASFETRERPEQSG